MNGTVRRMYGQYMKQAKTTWRRNGHVGQMQLLKLWTRIGLLAQVQEVISNDTDRFGVRDIHIHANVKKRFIVTTDPEYTNTLNIDNVLQRQNSMTIPLLLEEQYDMSPSEHLFTIGHQSRTFRP